NHLFLAEAQRHFPGSLVGRQFHRVGAVAVSDGNQGEGDAAERQFEAEAALRVGRPLLGDGDVLRRSWILLEQPWPVEACLGDRLGVRPQDAATDGYPRRLVVPRRRCLVRWPSVRRWAVRLAGG